MARAKKKAGSVKVNFKGVESRKTPPEGDYPMSVVSAESGTSSSGNDQIAVVAEITAGEYKGFKGYIYFPLAENSLWKLHAFLTACGEEVPEDEMDIELADLEGKEFMGVLSHETYNGRKKAKLTDFDSMDNYKGAADDEDDGKKSKKKDKKADKDDAGDKSSKKDKKADKKSSKDDAKSSKKDKAGKDDKKSKKAKKYSEDDINEMDEDELEEVIKAAKLDVDLDDIKKLAKKRQAVIDALEEENLIED